MTKMLLRYVHEFKDRHGKTRRYFRRPSFKRLPLPGAPGSEEFMAAYQAALAGATAPKLEAGAARTMPGTVAALVARYYRSAAFVGLAESTRSTYRGIIENFREKHGHRSIAQLDRETIKQLHANKAATPAAANNFLRIVRMLLDFAVDEQMLTANPAVGVKAMRYKSDGHALVRGADRSVSQTSSSGDARPARNGVALQHRPTPERCRHAWVGNSCAKAS